MIGVFDSGMGGLSVLRAVHELLPSYDLHYLADTAYCPYGPRSADEVRARSLSCARWLIEQGAELIVVACNTATSAAAELLRHELPVPVVAMEPGLKPAIAATHNGQVAVLATSGTLEGERFAQLVDRFARGVRVVTVACPDWVEQVEAGDLDGPATRASVAKHLEPLLAQGIDTLVLGCTHFPPLRPLIREIAGPDIQIIDTGPAVAAQVARIAQISNIRVGDGTIQYATTGEVAIVGPALERIWKSPQPVEKADC